MLNSKELRTKAWDSLKGKYWRAFGVVIVTGLLCSIGMGAVTGSQNLIDVVNMVEPNEMDSTMKIGALVLMCVSLVLGIIGLLLNIFIANPISVGCSNYFIKNTDSKPAFGEVFSGFKNKYGRNCGTLFLAAIKIILWSLLFVIPGIIKTYEYAILPYILADDAEISSKDAFKKAKQMMQGNKWRLFKLNLSFFGWFVLCVLTLGLGTFFLIPYVDAANAEFYVELKNR